MFSFSLFFPAQPPPTYEESIRQSVEVPYNIFPSCLGISPPQSTYTGSDTPHPVCSDSTVLPVWHWSSASDAQWRKDFGSFTTGGGTRLRVSVIDHDWIFHTNWFIWRWWTYSRETEQRTMEEPKRSCTLLREGHLQLGTFECQKAGFRGNTLDVNINKVAGTPRREQGYDIFQRGTSFIHDFFFIS